MATAQQAIHHAPRAAEPEAAQNETLAEMLDRRLASPLLLTLSEMCHLASLPLDAMVAQMVEGQIADFRRQRIHPTFMYAFRKEGEAKRIPDGDPRRKLTGEQRTRIREMRERGVSVDVVATRFGVGRNTIRRILKENTRTAKLGAIPRQRILHVHESEGLDTTQLARRFGVSRDTIAELLAEYHGAQHNAHAIQQSAPRHANVKLRLGRLSLPGPGVRR